MATASAPVVGAQPAGTDSRDARQIPVVKPVGQAAECAVAGGAFADTVTLDAASPV